MRQSDDVTRCDDRGRPLTDDESRSPGRPLIAESGLNTYDGMRQYHRRRVFQRRAKLLDDEVHGAAPRKLSAKWREKPCTNGMIARSCRECPKVATIVAKRDIQGAPGNLISIARRASVVRSALANPIDHGLNLCRRKVAEFRHFGAEAKIHAGHFVDNVTRAWIPWQNELAAIIALRSGDVHEFRVGFAVRQIESRLGHDARVAAHTRATRRENRLNGSGKRNAGHAAITLAIGAGLSKSALLSAGTAIVWIGKNIDTFASTTSLSGRTFAFTVGARRPRTSVVARAAMIDIGLRIDARRSALHQHSAAAAARTHIANHVRPAGIVARSAMGCVRLQINTCRAAARFAPHAPASSAASGASGATRAITRQSRNPLIHAYDLRIAQRSTNGHFDTARRIVEFLKKHRIRRIARNDHGSITKRRRLVHQNRFDVGTGQIEPRGGLIRSVATGLFTRFRKNVLLNGRKISRTSPAACGWIGTGTTKECSHGAEGRQQRYEKCCFVGS